MTGFIFTSTAFLSVHLNALMIFSLFMSYGLHYIGFVSMIAPTADHRYSIGEAYTIVSETVVTFF